MRRRASSVKPTLPEEIGFVQAGAPGAEQVAAPPRRACAPARRPRASSASPSAAQAHRPRTCASRAPSASRSVGGNCSIRRSTGAGRRASSACGPLRRARSRPRSSRRRAAGSRSRRTRSGSPAAARRSSSGSSPGSSRRSRSCRQSRNRSCRRRVGSSAVEHRDEEAAALDLLEQCAARGSPATAAQRGRQLGQHRAAQQEVAQLRRHGVEHLGGEVVEDVAVAARRRAGRRRSAPLGAARPGCSPPAAGRRASPGCARAGRRLVVGRADVAALRQQRAHLVAVEAQVALAELGQLAVRAQPRQRQRRLGPRRRARTPQCGGRRSSSSVEELEHRRVARCGARRRAR